MKVKGVIGHLQPLQLAHDNVTFKNENLVVPAQRETHNSWVLAKSMDYIDTATFLGVVREMGQESHRVRVIGVPHRIEENIAAGRDNVATERVHEGVAVAIMRVLSSVGVKLGVFRWASHVRRLKQKEQQRQTRLARRILAGADEAGA